MRSALVTVLVALVLAACGKSDEDCRDIQNKCDAIANDIRRAAVQRGISSMGICTSSNAQTQKDFGAACAALEDCNAEHADGCE